MNSCLLSWLGVLVYLLCTLNQAIEATTHTHSAPYTRTHTHQECYGEALSQLVLANLMATADYDGDGVVSVSEFVRICMSHEEAFRYGDVDGDGHMSFDEVWFMLKAHFDGKTGGSRSPIRGAGKGQGLTEGDVRRMFDEIDVDGVHGISWAEFREHLAQQREPASIVI